MRQLMITLTALALVGLIPLVQAQDAEEKPRAEAKPAPEAGGNVWARTDAMLRSRGRSLDELKAEQIIEIVDFIDKLMSTFGFDYQMMVSTRPDKAVGSDEIWETATNALKTAMDRNNRPSYNFV